MAISIAVIAILTFVQPGIIILQMRDVASVTVYVSLLPPLLFSLKHMALTHKIQIKETFGMQTFSSECIKIFLGLTGHALPG